jgi:hypothetical protein
MGSYFPMRPKLTARQLKARQPEAQAAENAAIMAELIAEDRRRRTAAHDAALAEKARRKQAMPPNPAPPSCAEFSLQQIEKGFDEYVERGPMLLAKKLAAFDPASTWQIGVGIRFRGGDGKFYEKEKELPEICSHLYALIIARHHGTWFSKGLSRSFNYWALRVPAGDYFSYALDLKAAALRRNRMAAREMVRGLPPDLRDLYIACLRDYHDQAREVRREHPKKVEQE